MPLAPLHRLNKREIDVLPSARGAHLSKNLGACCAFRLTKGGGIGSIHERKGPEISCYGVSQVSEKISPFRPTAGKNMLLKSRPDTLAQFDLNSFVRQPAIRGQHRSAATSDLIRVHKESAPYTRLRGH
jgi:hypothetical protein